MYFILSDKVIALLEKRNRKSSPLDFTETFDMVPYRKLLIQMVKVKISTRTVKKIVEMITNCEKY